MTVSDYLAAAWEERRAELADQLEGLESGAVQSEAEMLGAPTMQGIVRARSQIAEPDTLIAGRLKWTTRKAAPRVVYAIDRGLEPSDRSTMLAFVVAAFQMKGGRARLSEIYPEVRRLLYEHDRGIDEVEAEVRRRVYNFCPQRVTYLGTAIFKLCSWGEYKLELRIPFSELPDSLWEDAPASSCACGQA